MAWVFRIKRSIQNDVRQNALSKGAIHTWNVSENRPELVNTQGEPMVLGILRTGVAGAGSES